MSCDDSAYAITLYRVLTTSSLRPKPATMPAIVRFTPMAKASSGAKSVVQTKTSVVTLPQIAWFGNTQLSGQNTVVGKKAPGPGTKKVEAAKAKGNLAILARVEQLKVLSQLEKTGLLAKLEESGLTLTKIQELGLLSTAERLGVLSLVADTNTPLLLTVVGVFALAAAAGLIVLVPDDSAPLIAAQVVGGLVLLPTAIASLVGGNILGGVQKL
jgi:hypothetical protein